jgi:hypothetical protein
MSALGSAGEDQLTVAPRERCEAQAAGPTVAVTDGAAGPCVIGEPLVTRRSCDHAGAAQAGLVVTTAEQGPVDGRLGQGPRGVSQVT